MATATLTLDHVVKQFDTTDVLHQISYTFHQGNSYAIMGVSGTGKSTLLHLLAGLEHPTAGEVLFNGESLATFSEKKYQFFLNHHVGLVFQEPCLIQELTVLENTMIKGLIAQQSAAVCKKRATELLELIGLKERGDAYPYQLSGGQQQRVALARALFQQPTFILADEPTGNLDEENGMLIVQLFKRMQKEYGVGIIMSTHDQRVAQRMDTVLTIKAGTLYHTEGL